MPFKLEVNHPDFDKGWEFDCDGILVKNGESVTLTKEDELAFLGRWGHDVAHFYRDGTVAKVTGSSALTDKELKEARGDGTVSDVPAPTDETGDGGDA